MCCMVRRCCQLWHFALLHVTQTIMVGCILSSVEATKSLQCPRWTFRYQYITQLARLYLCVIRYSVLYIYICTYTSLEINFIIITISYPSLSCWWRRWLLLGTLVLCYGCCRWNWLWFIHHDCRTSHSAWRSKRGWWIMRTIIAMSIAIIIIIVATTAATINLPTLPTLPPPSSDTLLNFNPSSYLIISPQLETAVHAALPLLSPSSSPLSSSW